VLCLSITKKESNFLAKERKKKKTESSHSSCMLTIVGVKPQLIKLAFLGCFVINYGATELQIIFGG
jgi:hypothetical protein